MEDWNDLRLILAIGRVGSLTGAAKTLGVNHSTAFRRLNMLEERTGVRLFERLPGGVYLPTTAGEQMAETAERVETETAALDRLIAGRDHRLTGLLRVTSSETLAYRLLTHQLARFRALHPGILVELMIDNRVLSLSHREADVALRPARPKEGDLFGRKLADIGWTIYGASALVDELKRDEVRPPDPPQLDNLPLIGWEPDVGGVTAADWLTARVPDTQLVYRTNSLVNQMIAAKAGIGLAVLPCYLGDAEAGLVRFHPRPIPELTRELWVVAHNDLRRTARIRAFFDVVGEGLAAEHVLLSGQDAAREGNAR